MEQQVNKKYAPVFVQQPRPRYIILMGGRGAGRSTVASQYAIAKLAAPEYFRCAIMRFVLGDIRNSIYREITDRIEEQGIEEAVEVNSTTMTLKYLRNMINAVGFKKSSGDQKAKLKSLANYNTVIIEEADEIVEPDFVQLDDSLRTLKGDVTIFLLLNPPPLSHWIIQRWFDLVPSDIPGFFVPQLKKGIDDTLFIHTTYEDNRENISEAAIRNYESYKERKPGHYFNMIRGLVPEVVRGRIFSNWREIEAVPHEARLERYGLDYGYSNDPTAIIAIYYHNGGYILDEVTYQAGMSNRNIADVFKIQPKALVIPDSSEPKSNDELILYGVNLLPAQKGPGSVNQGIQKVQSVPISYTKRSVHIREEYENYAWMEDKDTGEFKNEPKPGYDHAMDAARYGLETLIVETDDAAEKADRLRSRLKSRTAQGR